MARAVVMGQPHWHPRATEPEPLALACTLRLPAAATVPVTVPLPLSHCDCHWPAAARGRAANVGPWYALKLALRQPEATGHWYHA
jgi:hypothetical protein